MGYVIGAMIAIGFLYALITNFPVLGVLVIVGIIIYVVYIIKEIGKAREKRLKDSQSLINLAVLYLEKGHEFAEKYSYSIEPSVLTIYPFKNDGDELIGFYTTLHTLREMTSVTHLYAEDFLNSKVVMDNNGWVAFEIEQIGVIKIGWNEFNEMVWSEIKRKHPDWKVNYVRPDKSAIMFNF